MSNELDENQINIDFLKEKSKKLFNNKNNFEIFFVNFKDTKKNWIFKKFQND